MYSVLNTLSEYTCFYISENSTSYTVLLFLKSLKAFSIPLRKKACAKIDVRSHVKQELEEMCFYFNIIRYEDLINVGHAWT